MMTKQMADSDKKLPRKIRVKFSPYGNTTHLTPGTYANFIYQLLLKRFAVKISDSPDFFFYHEASPDFLDYDCVKIFYTGENISPNFNFCDYAISFDWLQFEDRHYRFPLYLVNLFYRPAELKNTVSVDFTKPLNLTQADIAKKTEFCSFVYSNYRGETARRDIFNLLSTYKHVNAGGRFLNNIGYEVPDKFSFEKKHRFSIAFENSSRSGYTTEKIVNSLMAETIPIYWGDPHVGRQFNTKRFINCHDYPDLESVVERVREIDADDSLYLQIVNEPVLAEGFNPTSTIAELEDFLDNICTQEAAKAKRATINPVRKNELEAREKISLSYTHYRSLLIGFIATIYGPLRKIKFIDEVKQKILNTKK